MLETNDLRDILRNPSLLKIDFNDSCIIEDKRKQELLNSAKKVMKNSKQEYENLEDSISDGIK